MAQVELLARRAFLKRAGRAAGAALISSGVITFLDGCITTQAPERKLGIQGVWLPDSPQEGSKVTDPLITLSATTQAINGSGESAGYIIFSLVNPHFEELKKLNPSIDTNSQWVDIARVGDNGNPNVFRLQKNLGEVSVLSPDMKLRPLQPGPLTLTFFMEGTFDKTNPSPKGPDLHIIYDPYNAPLK